MKTSIKRVLTNLATKIFSNKRVLAFIQKDENITIHYNTMKVDSKTHLLFCMILFCNVMTLLFMIGDTSIYIQEAQGYFENTHFPYLLANFGVNFLRLFSDNPLLNDYGLRLPFVCIHIYNCFLLYRISLLVLHKPNDVLFCVMLYMAIPGVSIGALIVSNIGILTCASLLVIYYQIRYNIILYPIFIIIAILDSGGAILCLSLFFYALFYRRSKTLIFSLICFGINMAIFAPIHGVPKTYFLDTIGLLAIIFTPIFFIYYVAILYNHTIHTKQILLNLIPFIGLLFVLLLSTRQQILIQNFLPQISVGIPLFVQKIMYDIRSRLPQFQMGYVLRLWLVILFLLLGNLVLFGNKLTYLIVNERNFAYSFYGAKEIAKQLHNRGINTIEIPNQELKLRLKFYGINTNPTLKPKYILIQTQHGSIQVKYFNSVVASYKVLKIK